MIKVTRHIMSISFILTILLLTIFFNPKCKDPNEYKPPVDSLLPPPPPPNLLTPVDSFVHMPLGDNRLLISWEQIEGATIYEINFVAEILGEWTLQLDTNALSQNWFGIKDKVVWKVRAYGPKWDYYTDWSAPRYFEIVRFPFSGPEVIYPPNGATLVFDSLPAEITLQWKKLSNAQYYDVNVFLDTTLIYENTLYDQHYTIIIDSATNYFWAVRAGSEKWEFPTSWSAALFSVQLSKR